MRVANEVSRHMLDHDTLVERVIAEESILPAFRLASHIMGVQTVELKHGCRIRRLRHGERRHASAIHGGGHGTIE